MWRAKRMTKKMSLLLIALLIATMTVVGVSAAAGETSPNDPATAAEAAPPDPWQDPAYQTKVRDQNARAVFNQSQTRAWHYRVEGAPRLPGLARKLPMSHDLQTEVHRTKLWSSNRARAKARYLAWNAHWERLNGNMWQAIEAAAKEYGVSASWLHACAASEGGHNGWVMNHGGSGAGGWFQFMSGTFYGNVGAARSVNRFPRKYAEWHSRVGQAFTAAYMFKIGQSGQWTGAGC